MTTLCDLVPQCLVNVHLCNVAKLYSFIQDILFNIWILLEYVSTWTVINVLIHIEFSIELQDSLFCSLFPIIWRKLYTKLHCTELFAILDTFFYSFECRSGAADTRPRLPHARLQHGGYIRHPQGSAITGWFTSHGRGVQSDGSFLQLILSSLVYCPYYRRLSFCPQLVGGGGVYIFPACITGHMNKGVRLLRGGGVSGQGSVWPEVEESDPRFQPRMVTAAVGKHPNGMHSFLYNTVYCLYFISWI